MKKHLVCLIVIGITLFMTATGYAATLFGPSAFTRTTGEADLYTESFDAVPGEYYLFVKTGNNDGTNRVSSAYVYLNDELIFAPNDFEQNDAMLMAPIQANNTNTLTVELASGPGSFLTIEIRTACPLIFSPGQYIRTKGKPNIYSDTFIATPGEAFVTLINGNEDGGNRVTSGSIYINGEPVFETDVFKSGDFMLAAELILEAANTITVELNSKPNTFLGIEICQNPPTVDLSVIPEIIIEGQSAELSWVSDFALNVSIDNGIGPVDLNGAMTVSPLVTTTYAITATNAGASASDSVTLAVIPLPRVTLTATPSTIFEGESFDLSWTSLHSDTVVIDNGIWEVALNGTIPLSPVVDTTYTITAHGHRPRRDGHRRRFCDGDPFAGDNCYGQSRYYYRRRIV